MVWWFSKELSVNAGGYFCYQTRKWIENRSWTVTNWKWNGMNYMDACYCWGYFCSHSIYRWKMPIVWLHINEEAVDYKDTMNLPYFQIAGTCANAYHAAIRTASTNFLKSNRKWHKWVRCGPISGQPQSNRKVYFSGQIRNAQTAIKWWNAYNF